MVALLGKVSMYQSPESVPSAPLASVLAHVAGGQSPGPQLGQHWEWEICLRFRILLIEFLRIQHTIITSNYRY